MAYPGDYMEFMKAVLFDKFAPTLLSAEEQRTLFDLLAECGVLNAGERDALKKRYLTPEELQAESDAEARKEREQEQKREASRVQHIRDEYAAKLGSFKDVYRFLDGHRYHQKDLLTACAFTADGLDTQLKGTAYTLGCLEIGWFLKICGVLAAQKAMKLESIQKYVQLIRDGYKTLEWGEDFAFVESPSIEESAEKIIKLYLQEVEKYGLDNVALLTPYRKKTETSVDALNARLRGLVNPPSPRKPEAHHGRKAFRVGDKVMQIKNAREVNNGDVGYIFNISYSDDVVIQVDFSGRTVDYSTDELALLDWAYASTVHKAQGSEYESVIVAVCFLFIGKIFVFEFRLCAVVILPGRNIEIYTQVFQGPVEHRNIVGGIGRGGLYGHHILFIRSI